MVALVGGQGLTVKEHEENTWRNGTSRILLEISGIKFMHMTTSSKCTLKICIFHHKFNNKGSKHYKQILNSTDMHVQVFMWKYADIYKLLRNTSKSKIQKGVDRWISDKANITKSKSQIVDRQVFIVKFFQLCHIFGKFS